MRTGRPNEITGPWQPHPMCPKAMTYGPCGGVGSDDRCEVDQRICPFCVEDDLRAWSGPTHEPRPVDLPLIIVDLRPDVTDARGLHRTAGRLAPHGVAVLLGEHLDDPAPSRPHLAARIVAETGVPVVATITPRARTTDECRAEIDALIAAGVAVIHCVTGDHPAVRFGPGRSAEFAMDGTALAAMARARGAWVSVAESPASPPVTWRARRLHSKQRAGADLAFLNHAGPADDLVAFAHRCRAAGVVVPLVAPVPVITDHRSARALEQFPGLRLPPGLVTSILEAPDATRAGTNAAIVLGRALLASGRFSHINLSGSASGAGPHERVALMCEVAAGILDPPDRVVF